MTTPTTLDVIDRSEIDALIARLDTRSLGEDDAPQLAELLRLLVRLADELESQKTSVHRLQRLLFGSSSEKRSPKVTSTDESPLASSEASQQTSEKDDDGDPKPRRRGRQRATQQTAARTGLRLSCRPAPDGAS